MRYTVILALGCLVGYLSSYLQGSRPPIADIIHTDTPQTVYVAGSIPTVRINRQGQAVVENISGIVRITRTVQGEQVEMLHGYLDEREMALGKRLLWSKEPEPGHFAGVVENK